MHGEETDEVNESREQGEPEVNSGNQSVSYLIICRQQTKRRKQNKK